MLTILNKERQAKGRSREGAWIEICDAVTTFSGIAVAPARERGLKCDKLADRDRELRRSREGAWIEILTHIVIAHTPAGTPARERGLKCECE